MSHGSIIFFFPFSRDMSYELCMLFKRTHTHTIVNNAVPLCFEIEMSIAEREKHVARERSCDADK
jgi:hypothetical protein